MSILQVSVVDDSKRAVHVFFGFCIVAVIAYGMLSGRVAELFSGFRQAPTPVRVSAGADEVERLTAEVENAHQQVKASAVDTLARLSADLFCLVSMVFTFLVTNLARFIIELVACVMRYFRGSGTTNADELRQTIDDRVKAGLKVAREKLFASKADLANLHASVVSELTEAIESGHIVVPIPPIPLVPPRRARATRQKTKGT